MTLLPAASLLLSSLTSAQPYRNVEVCFVLDTTGSMANLIETAKQKIWFIASEIVQTGGQGNGVGVQFCLLGFRDRGDAYVTRHFDLTRDLDSIHQELMAFTADGGGDTPEAVNQALLEAVQDSSWSDSPDVLKLIFLVGDAPPHTDYNEPQYPAIAAKAAKLGIIINPILVGHSQRAREAWQTIAEGAHGESVALGDNDAPQTIETVMDQDIAVLGPRLARLAIPYGPPAEQLDYFAVVDRSEELDDAVAADRVAYQLGADATVGTLDLIDALDSGSIEFESIKPEWLPDAVRSMTEEELLEHLSAVRVRRGAIRGVIQSLVEERRQIIEAQQREGSFEAHVSRLIARQLKRP